MTRAKWSSTRKGWAVTALAALLVCVVTSGVNAGSAAAGDVDGAPVAGSSTAATADSAPVPPPFSPSSTSWTSATEGWVLGWTPCGSEDCARLMHTTNGGDSWTEVNAPDVSPSIYSRQTRVFFAQGGGHTVGLVTNGNELYTSFDGGRTWQRESFPGADKLGAIGSTSKEVYMVAFRGPGYTTTTYVLRTPLAERDWQKMPGVAVTGDGSVSSYSSSISGTGKELQIGTSAWGGAVRLWSSGALPTGSSRDTLRTSIPCSDHSVMQAGLAAAGRSYVVCSYNPGIGHMYKQLKSSPDGVSFSPVSKAPLAGITSDFAVTGTGTLAVGARGGGTGIVYMSFDGGQSWSTNLWAEDTGTVNDLAFQDPLHGTLVAGSAGIDHSVVYRTVDGGHTWTPLKF
ncbi:MAG: WD40/YVTN/BNR-like repeat-containing protein [Nocardioidaceae bacterium]